MISKTRMLFLVQNLRWKEIARGIQDNPSLIDVRDKKGRNWLHLCCSNNLQKKGLKPEDSIRTAEVLIKGGIDINVGAFSQGDWKATPLWYSVAFGRNVALSEYLLASGSDPNYCLFAAAYNDDAKAIRLLIRHGAEGSLSPVFLAAVQSNRLSAAEELLNLGADVNFQDRKGMTALHYLLKRGRDIKYVRMLLKHRARTDIKNVTGISAADILMRKRDPQWRKLVSAPRGKC